MNKPQISVIIPCYNQAQYLDECLQSVLDQTYQDWECIIVNDGSPDNTEKVVKKWVEKDARFKYLHKENGGVASARNFAIKNAVGEWVLPLDGDDKIASTYLQLASQKFDKGYDLIYCNAKFFGIKDENWILPNYSLEELLKNNIIFCSAFFKKSKIGLLLYDENLTKGLEDWEFWISYLSQNDTLVFRFNETLFYYRIKENSRNQAITDSQEHLNNARMYVFKKHLTLYYSIFGDYFQLINDNQHLERENQRLEHDNQYLKNKIESKRYKFFQKILNFLRI